MPQLPAASQRGLRPFTRDEACRCTRAGLGRKALRRVPSSGGDSPGYVYVVQDRWCEGGRNVGARGSLCSLPLAWSISWSAQHLSSRPEGRQAARERTSGCRFCRKKVIERRSFSMFAPWPGCFSSSDVCSLSGAPLERVRSVPCSWFARGHGLPSRIPSRSRTNGCGTTKYFPLHSKCIWPIWPWFQQI